jgi:predicted RNA binding protein YcfA (HicA-like mRNA interferase family)
LKLPRDLNGLELAKLLKQYGYLMVHQTGSHIRLTSSIMKIEHHITIPRHTPLKVGTLNSILVEVASYLEIDRKILINKLFS